MVYAAAGGFYSEKLKAKLQLEYLTLGPYRFWGARIVEQRAGSPTLAAGLRLGDVISRLDGSRIGRGRYRTTDPVTGVQVWAIPEADLHYGWTQLRWIKTGSTQVRNTWVNLGPWNPGGGGGGTGGGGAP